MQDRDFCHYGSVRQFETKCGAPGIVLFVQDCFGYLQWDGDRVGFCLLCFHMKFSIFSSSVRNAVGILMAIALNL